MKTKAHIIGLLVGVLITPLAVFLGIMSAAAGHGDYFLAKILFPFTMLSTSILGSITPAFILLALAQFPAYGWLFGNSARSSRWKPVHWAFAAHLVGVMLNLIIPNPNL